MTSCEVFKFAPHFQCGRARSALCTTAAGSPPVLLVQGRITFSSTEGLRHVATEFPVRLMCLQSESIYQILPRHLPESFEIYFLSDVRTLEVDTTGSVLQYFAVLCSTLQYFAVHCGIVLEHGVFPPEQPEISLDLAIDFVVVRCRACGRHRVVVMSRVTLP